MRRRTRKGGYFYHYCVATKDGRRYLPRARLALVETQIEIEKRSRAMLRVIQEALKTGDSGRPAIMDYGLRKMLVASGHTVRADKIYRNKKRYFTPEAIDYRYSLLDDDLKSIVGSPMNLAALERQALGRLRSYSGRKSGGKTFDSCFREILLETCQKPCP